MYMIDITNTHNHVPVSKLIREYITISTSDKATNNIYELKNTEIWCHIIENTISVPA